MYNAKAFLEGLIVNEVLTKTASFEKLAQQPYMFYPTWNDVIQNFRAQTAAEAAQRDTRRQEAQERANYLRQIGYLGYQGVESRLPKELRESIARNIMKGRLPTKEEVDALAKRYPVKQNEQKKPTVGRTSAAPNIDSANPFGDPVRPPITPSRTPPSKGTSEGPLMDGSFNYPTPKIKNVLNALMNPWKNPSRTPPSKGTAEGPLINESSNYSALKAKDTWDALMNPWKNPESPENHSSSFPPHYPSIR
jgi:hypothetical protein